MNQRVVLALACFLIFTTAAACAQEQPSILPSSYISVYVGSTPCSQGSLPLPGMQTDKGCELIKWTLVLYRQTDEPYLSTTFTLHCIYGMSQPGTTGFVGGGTKIDIEGNWTIKGMRSDPRARIFRLEDAKTKKLISFLQLSDDLIHLLDSDHHLMIGNAAWSYTLNRVRQ